MRHEELGVGRLVGGGPEMTEYKVLRRYVIVFFADEDVRDARTVTVDAIMVTVTSGRDVQLAVTVT